MVKAFRVAMATAITAAAVVGVGSASAQDSVKAEAFATGIQVTNLSDSEANVTISFYQEGDGTAVTNFNDTIAANDNKFYSDLSADIAGLPEGFNGSAVISSDQEVAATVNAIEPGNFFNGATISGASEGATEVLMPLIFKNQAGSAYDTFVNVQNTSTETANVTITYDDPNNSTETATIPPGASARFDQATNDALPDDFTGSAIVTSDQPVAAVVIQNGDSAIMGYNAFTSTSTAPLVPLVVSLFRDEAPWYFSGVSIQNAGDTDTEVVITYTPSENDEGELEGTTCTETRTIPARGSANYASLLTFGIDPNDPPTSTTCEAGLFVGSAQVTTNSANQPLVAIANQLSLSDSKGGAANAVDVSEATDKVTLVVVQDRASGYFTSFSIVNVGTSETTVTCQYAGSDFTHSETLAPGQTWSEQHINLLGEGYSASGFCEASSSDARIIGTMNQLNSASSDDAFFVSNLINY